MRIEVANRSNTNTGLCMLCRADPLSGSARCTMCRTLSEANAAHQRVEVDTIPVTPPKSVLVEILEKIQADA